MEIEDLICGFNAVMAAVRSRPEGPSRLFFLESMAPHLGKVCRNMASERKLYRVCPAPELEKIAQTTHHGGVIAYFPKRPVRCPLAADLAVWNSSAKRILIIDGVSNPHNLGALVRTAAFLGLGDVLVDKKTARALLTPSALRTAEGGYEALAIWEVESVEAFLTTHHKDLVLAGTDMHGSHTPIELANEPRVQNRALGLIFGNEEEGLSPAIRALCHHMICIPGSGAVESLNVAQASAIILYQFSQKFDLPKLSKPTGSLTEAKKYEHGNAGPGPSPRGSKPRGPGSRSPNPGSPSSGSSPRGGRSSTAGRNDKAGSPSELKMPKRAIPPKARVNKAEDGSRRILVRKKKSD